MLNVFKNTDYQLVVETEYDLIIKIEKRYGIENDEIVEIEIDDDRDILKLYNQLGKLLGYPEMKGE